VDSAIVLGRSFETSVFTYQTARGLDTATHVSRVLSELSVYGRNTVGGTPCTGDQLVGMAQNGTRNESPVSRMGFEPTNPAFERTKTVQCDREADRTLNFTLRVENKIWE
jgi:hypothetical protein